MSDLVVTYASVTNLVCAWFPTVNARLSVAMGDRSISTNLPVDYKDALPFIRVTRLGGTRQLGIDRARVRFETFAAAYDDAETLANELDSLIEFDLNSFSDGVGRVILTGPNNIPPVYADFGDPQVTRFLGTYWVTVGALQ